jgi:nucleoside 2-deoxyribosyltransferase
MTSERVKIYLAGPILGTADAELRGWRNEARRRLFFADVVDPAERDYRGREEAFAEEIVLADKAAIDTCDAVLAYCPRPSAGTAMEILYAWERSTPVAAWVPPGVPVSPWIRYHSLSVSRFASEAVGVLFRESLRRR